MLPCITCSDQKNTESIGQQVNDDTATATPRTKQAIKALTTQIKDMAVKATGMYKKCKPCLGSTNHKTSPNYADLKPGSLSNRFPYAYRRSASTKVSGNTWDKEMEARLKGIYSGESTPRSISARTESNVSIDENSEPKEWVAQVEPGVLITLVSFPQGGNDLKRIQFSREMYNKWQAQRWWAENYDRVLELYNVEKFNREVGPLPIPPRNDDDITLTDSSEHSNLQDESCGLTSSPKLSNITTSSRDTEDYTGGVPILENEWSEPDDPGVYITLRTTPGGGRELRRVRFCREIFDEKQARLWWEQNKSRILEQYL